MSFGERLAQARKEQNLTVKALAAACWTSTTVIHHYEKGRRMPSAELLIRLCNTLKVSPAALLRDELHFTPPSPAAALLDELAALTPEKRAELSAFLSLLQNALQIPDDDTDDRP